MPLYYCNGNHITIRTCFLVSTLKTLPIFQCPQNERRCSGNNRFHTHLNRQLNTVYLKKFFIHIIHMDLHYFLTCKNHPCNTFWLPYRNTFRPTIYDTFDIEHNLDANLYLKLLTKICHEWAYNSPHILRQSFLC